MWNTSLRDFCSLLHCVSVFTFISMNERASERGDYCSVLSLYKLFLTSVQKAFILSCENSTLFHSRLQHTKYSVDRSKLNDNVHRIIWKQSLMLFFSSGQNITFKIKPHSCLWLSQFACNLTSTATLTEKWESINTLTLSLVYSKTVKFLRTVSTLRPLKTSSLRERKRPQRNQLNMIKNSWKQHQQSNRQDFRTFHTFFHVYKLHWIHFDQKKNKQITSNRSRDIDP